MLESAHFSKGYNYPPPPLAPLPTSLHYKKIFFTYTNLYFYIMHTVSYSYIRASFFSNAAMSVDLVLKK